MKTAEPVEGLVGGSAAASNHSWEHLTDTAQRNPFRASPILGVEGEDIQLNAPASTGYSAWPLPDRAVGGRFWRQGLFAFVGSRSARACRVLEGTDAASRGGLS